MKKYATISARSHSRPAARRSQLRQSWPRRSRPSFEMVAPPENQVVRGLIVGLPLALALWAILAVIVWRTF